MNEPVKQYSLVAMAIALSLAAFAGVICERRKVKGQMRAVRTWNTWRVPVDTVFVGDHACGECHKKLFASHGQSGMAMAMEPVAGSLVLIDNPKLSLRVGPYTYEIRRNGKQSVYSVTDGKETISYP